MGLFDEIIQVTASTEESILNPAEAFAAITLVAVSSDGYLANEESKGLFFNLSRMQMFRSYSDDVMRRMFDKLLGIIRREGCRSLVNRAKISIPYELRPTAFAIAVDLVFADGIVTPEENDFLNDLYQILEISEEVALRIVEVMQIKNRG